MRPTFKEYLNELSSVDVAAALSPTDQQVHAQMSEPAAKRQQDLRQQQDLQMRSNDPLDRQIAQARAKLAQLLQQKAMRDKKTATGAAAQPAPAQATTESAIAQPFTLEHLKGMAERIYNEAEKKAYSESSQYAGGTRVSGDNIAYHAEEIVKAISHIFMDDIGKLIRTKHMS